MYSLWCLLVLNLIFVTQVHMTLVLALVLVLQTWCCQHVMTCDNVRFFSPFYLLFITCTFTFGHMTDNLPFLTWLTWSHTLLSHVTHHLMTHIDSGWLIVTHWCFTLCCFIYICFIFCFMTHMRTFIVLITYCSSDVHCHCDVYCSCDAIVHFTIKSGLLSSL